MASWGHRLFLLDTNWTPFCAARNCYRSAAYESAYEKMHPRSGKPCTARRVLCKKHAAEFAKRHGLEVVAEGGEQGR